jgi:hypothetical protein
VVERGEADGAAFFGWEVSDAAALGRPGYLLGLIAPSPEVPAR